MKFKVWDLRKKQFIDVGLKNFVLNHEGRLFVIEESGCTIAHHRYHRVDSTGEHDKYGVEIYYGDVVKDDIHSKYEVDNLCVALWICDMDKMNNPLSRVEIIGNILHTLS